MKITLNSLDDLRGELLEVDAKHTELEDDFSKIQDHSELLEQKLLADMLSQKTQIETTFASLMRVDGDALAHSLTRAMNEKIQKVKEEMDKKASSTERYAINVKNNWNHRIAIVEQQLNLGYASKDKEEGR